MSLMQGDWQASKMIKQQKDGMMGDGVKSLHTLTMKVTEKRKIVESITVLRYFL